MGEETIEKLEAEYKGLLKANIQNLKSGDKNAISRLDQTGRQSSNNLAGSKTDIIELQEIFKNKEGMDLTGKSYQDIIQGLCSGAYKNKHVPNPNSL